MGNIKDDQRKFFDYIENSIINNNRISHAYLIETKCYKDYDKVIKEFIRLILEKNKTRDEIENIDNMLDNNDYPDLNYIYPDGASIKKEQLLNLENEYMKKSMLDNKLIYVIDPADKLNQSSANTILKFLEEPPEDVVAILITENKYTVLETIVSRCQILSLVNNIQEELNEEILEFVNDMNLPKNILIKYDYYLEKIFSDRVVALNSLKEIEECLFRTIKENIFEENKKNFIVNQIGLIEDLKEKLEYNVNMKLWFSNYIFNIMEVNKNA